MPIENAVCNELDSFSEDVPCQSGNRDIDFVVTGRRRKAYVRAAYMMLKKDAADREESPRL